MWHMIRYNMLMILINSDYSPVKFVEEVIKIINMSYLIICHIQYHLLIMIFDDKFNLYVYMKFMIIMLYVMIIMLYEIDDTHIDIFEL